MSATSGDATLARGRLRERGWIDRRVESFRHLPPPGIEAWLGAGADAAATGPHGEPAGEAWRLLPVREAASAVSARWLDALDAGARAELFRGLPLPDAGDAAPFAWAHRALCRGGLHLRIAAADAADAADVAQPVTVHLQLRPEAAASAPLLVVDVEPGARAVLVETHERPVEDGPDGIVQNLQVHLRLGAGSTLRHLRAALPAARDRVAHHVHARLERSARYEQVLVATGSAYHLQRSDVELRADAGSAVLASVACATDATLDRQVRVTHAAPGTVSAVEQLALAGGGSRMVLNADTRIAPGAHEANVRQHLAAIPTGGRPNVVLRPHLEILHDAVAASHGATWGALPEDALFYARQRGLAEPQARALVVEGMAAAVVARGFTDAALPEALAIDRLLARVIARHLAGTAMEVSDA